MLKVLLIVNLQNSISIRKINKIDHYIWWLNNVDRKSYIVARENTDLLILYHSVKFLKKKKNNISWIFCLW